MLTIWRPSERVNATSMECPSARDDLKICRQYYKRINDVEVWPNGKLTSRLIISNNTTFPAVYKAFGCPGGRSERKGQGKVSKYG